jgi:uncharacterized protein Yka (UPF0111/DUF47 family)
MMTLIFDIILCIALIGATYVGAQLWRKIDIIKASQEDFGELIHQLNSSSEQARNSIYQLRAILKEADSKLEDRLKKAHAMSDELSIITESGDRLASRLSNDLLDKNKSSKKIIPDINRNHASADVMQNNLAPSRAESDALAKILQGLR